MPDMQTALTKALNQVKFDDDPTDSPDTETEEQPNGARHMFWAWLKDNPGSTTMQAEQAMGIKNLSASVLTMMERGQLSRVKTDTGPYRYFAVGDEYKVMSKAESVARMLEAKAVSNANRKARKARKPRKDKGLARPHTTKAYTQANGDAVIERPKSKAFNADEILAGLNVLQARELMDKLQKLFGGRP